MQLGASFDTSRVHRADLHFHNIESTGHFRQLEDDYKLLQNNGFSIFRDSAYLSYTFSRYGINWDYLDRLAGIAVKDSIKIMLSISHYEMPYMPDSTIQETDRFIRFLQELAQRYKGVFHSYLPVVESGFWCQKLMEDWLPHFNSWWEAFSHVADLTVMIASTIKNEDPKAKIAMAEPFYWRDMADNCRPFDTLLGKYDALATTNDCPVWCLGDESLLDIIGLNIYSLKEIGPLIRAAEQRYEGKTVLITETNNNFSEMSVNEYRDFLNLMSDTELSGMKCKTAFWNPVIQMNRFEDGLPIQGGYLFDQQRKKCY